MAEVRRDVFFFHTVPGEQTPKMSHLFSSQKTHALHPQHIMSSRTVNDSTDM
jgi:hypothetical protein